MNAIPFLKWTKWYVATSVILILLSLVGIFGLGFRYSVEFVGGSNLSYRISPEMVNEAVVTDYAQSVGINVKSVRFEENVVDIRTEALSDQQEKGIREYLAQRSGEAFAVLRVETVGPSLSQDNLVKTAIAVGLGVLGILLYTAYAYKNFNFAFGAVAALFHDVFILIGAYAFFSYFFGAELDTLFVTAALTTMSFSVHDTIVMYDQMRMYVRKYGTKDIETHANRAITDTIVRSINNSLTIAFMLLALLLLGGSTIRFFAGALLVGTIIGTYSSPFVSIPLAVWLEKRKRATHVDAKKAGKK